MKTRPLSSIRRPRSGQRGGGRAGARGFALIEALVSLLLFSLGILGLIGLQARAMAIAGDAQDRTRAALLADQCASAIQLQAPAMNPANAADINNRIKGSGSQQGICNTDAWQSLASDSTSGLPGGRIAVAIKPPYTGPTTTAALVPVDVDITVYWAPPARSKDNANARGSRTTTVRDSQFQTHITLLLKNS